MPTAGERMLTGRAEAAERGAARSPSGDRAALWAPGCGLRVSGVNRRQPAVQFAQDMFHPFQPLSGWTWAEGESTTCTTSPMSEFA